MPSPVTPSKLGLTQPALLSASALIAYEVKNALNNLNAVAYLLRSGGDSESGVAIIRSQVDRLGHLASSLMSFAAPLPAQLHRISVDEAVRLTLDGLQAHPERAEVRLEMQLDRTLEVSANPFLLAIALDNLLRNAVEAGSAAKDMGKTPEPTVWLRAVRSGSEGHIFVEDNGGGPTPGIEDQLFVPFSTTKARGVGLGLAMARQAVEEQGGALSFERTPLGSRFTIRLKALP